jgi:peptidoglycan/LPS O-acetylase OafA/YrhL
MFHFLFTKKTQISIEGRIKMSISQLSQKLRARLFTDSFDYPNRKVAARLMGGGAIANIQVLRAFAAAIVVLYHIVKSPVGNGASFGLMFDPWGAAGVDLFFVISGFIMVHVQDTKARSPIEFARNRTIRIVPLYWAITFGWALIIYAFSSDFRDSYKFEHIIFSMFFISGVVGFDFPFLLPGWTLEYEALFYFLFTLSILAVGKRYFFLLLFSVMALSLIISEPMLAEFILGMLSARIYTSGLVRRFSPFLLTIGVTSFFAGAFVDLNFGSYGADRGWYRVWFWGVPSVLVVASACNVRQLSSKSLLYLGASSYSIYLVHFIVIQIFYKLIPVSGDAPIVFLFIICISVGCLTYKLVEMPLGIIAVNLMNRSRLLSLSKKIPKA